MRWTDKYVGRPYVDGAFDCADLARLVMIEHYGRAIALPSNRDYWGKQGLSKVSAMGGQIAALRDTYAAPCPAPIDGGAALLMTRGRVNHIGVTVVFKDIPDRPHVLHAASAQRQVLCTPVDDLTRLNIGVQGWYRWI